MRPLSKQKQHNEMLVSTEIKLAPVKRLKKLLQESQNKSYDPIENAMNRHPGLTRELAERMAKAFGF